MNRHVALRRSRCTTRYRRILVSEIVTRSADGGGASTWVETRLHTAHRPHADRSGDVAVTHSAGDNNTVAHRRTSFFCLGRPLFV